MATYDRYTAAGTQLTVTSIGQIVDAKLVADLSSDPNTLGGVAADQFTYGGISFTFIGTVELGSQFRLGSSLTYGFIGQSPDGGLSLFVPHGEPSIAGLSNLTLCITPSPGEAAGANEWILATTVDPGCLLEGTLLRTPQGERPIETLRAGDLVTTTDGTHKPIRWVGRSTIIRFGRDSLSLFPIRIRAGALDEAMPERDLLISPNHATFIDDVLVQAGTLVNGVSIVQETQMPPIFTYYSVELAEHTLLVADGTLVESFLDRAERTSFDNWTEHELLAGTPPASAEMAYPRVKSARQIPTVIRTMLLAQQPHFLTDQVAA